MTAFEDLLAVQALDTTADQLRHRRATLPERAELEGHHRSLSGIEARAGSVRGERDPLAAEQRRLEDDIASLTEKATQADKLLYGGTVSNLRELRGLQDEIASLERRRGQLEDRVIELMEQIEPLDEQLAGLDGERSSADAAAVEVTARLAEAEAAIDAELGDVEAQRAAAVGPVPAELVREYEDLRRRQAGIGIARLTGTRCEGCHLALPAMEIDRIRREPPDAVVHCSECGRLLVR